MSSGSTTHAPSLLPVLGSQGAVPPAPSAAIESSSEDVASVLPESTKNLNLTPSETTALTTRGKQPAARAT